MGVSLSCRPIPWVKQTGIGAVIGHEGGAQITIGTCGALARSFGLVLARNGTEPRDADRGSSWRREALSDSDIAPVEIEGCRRMALGINGRWRTLARSFILCPLIDYCVERGGFVVPLDC